MGTGSAQGPPLGPDTHTPPAKALGWSRAPCPHLADENLGHLPVVVKGGQVQGREAVLLLGIHQLACASEKPPDSAGGAGRCAWGPDCVRSGPAATRESGPLGAPLPPNSQRVALEGRMVQQGEALAVRGGDVDARHLGEDLHDAAGASTRRDGTVQRRVGVGILPAGGPGVTRQEGQRHCVLEPGASGPSTYGQVDVTAALTEDPHNLQEAPLHGHVEGCAPGAIQGIGPAAGAQEQAGSLGLVPDRRGSSRAAMPTGLRAAPHPPPRRPLARASPQGGVVQRRVTLVVWQVRGRPGLQQQPHQLHLAQVGGHLQGRPSLVLGVHLPGEPPGQSLV